MKTKATVIVLTKNNPTELKETISSIKRQNIANFLEVLVIESWEKKCHLNSILNEVNSSSFSSFKVFRQWPPRGIYPAMNIAISLVSTELLLFLNAGDSFYDSISLSALINHWEDMSTSLGYPLSCTFGQAKIQAWDNLVTWLSPPKNLKSLKKWLKFTNPCHQSFLFYAPWAKENLYEINYPIYADSLVMYQALVGDPQNYFLDKIVVNYNLNGLSSKPPSLKLLLKLWPVLSFRKKIILLVKFLLAPFEFFFPLFMYIKAGFVNFWVNNIA